MLIVVQFFGCIILIIFVEFELSRGYKIERMQYVTSLYESCRPGCKSYMAVSYRGKPSSSPCTIETIESEFVATVFDVYIWY